MERNHIGMRSKGGSKNIWKDEVLNALKKFKVVKDRKALYELMQETKSHKGL